MGDDNRKTIPTARKTNKWFLAFWGMAVVCMALLVGLMLRDGRMDVAAAASEPGKTVEPAIEDDRPSVQAQDVATRDSVESVQLMPSVQAIDSVQRLPSAQSVESVQSVQSDQGTVGLTIADIEKLQLADLKERADLPAEWRNILLLGSDSRDMEKISLFDTIIIASINVTTGELKLTSILRDTVVPITGRGLLRINTAAYYGGPSLMMQVINENFGMNITEYVLVNFAGMAKAIDALGGISLDINQKEMTEINRHMGEIAMYTMDKADYLKERDGMKLKAPGADVLY